MKLNIGCGWRDFGKDWIHIDGGNYDHLDSDDIFVTEYKNNSVDLIYASHFIEYFDREEVVPLLERWREVLKPSGVMRLAVPNFSKIASLEDKYAHEQLKESFTKITSDNDPKKLLSLINNTQGDDIVLFILPLEL